MALLCVVWVKPVPALRTVTVASGTAAPEESLMDPPRLAVVNWAFSDAPAKAMRPARDESEMASQASFPIKLSDPGVFWSGNRTGDRVATEYTLSKGLSTGTGAATHKCL